MNDDNRLRPLHEALAEMGVEVVPGAAAGRLPVVVHGPPSRGNVAIRGDISSQFVSAALMAMPWTGEAGRIEISGELISRPYVELTLGLMEKFGVKVAREDWRAFEIPANAAYASPGTLHVEGDASSASYFLGMGALGGGPVRVEGVGRDSLQGDVKFAQVLEQLSLELRAVFVLYELEEFTMAEISEALEIPPGTVASRLRRGRETFERLAAKALAEGEQP